MIDLSLQTPLPLAAYGLEKAEVTPLAGGVINRAYLVSRGTARYVLKEYSGRRPMTPERIGIVCQAQVLARERGLPVPRVVSQRDGAMFAEVDGVYFVLSEYVAGRVYDGSEIPVRAARQMGTVLAQLHDALAELPAGQPSPFPDLMAFESKVRSMLTFVGERALGDPMDTLAGLILAQKLADSKTLPDPPAVGPCQWLHGDFTPRNVLFGEGDEVVAVIDFDNMPYLPRPYDVMRSLTLGFPPTSSQAESFFAGYSSASRLPPEEIGRFVSYWRYVSTLRLWPLDVRYLDLEHYDPVWDQAIASLAPMSQEEWDNLTARLTVVVTR